MMLIFFFGMGASALLCALAQNAWQMAIALSILGLFSAIYHPVGIPMLLQHAASRDAPSASTAWPATWASPSPPS